MQPDAETFVLSATQVTTFPFVPELRVRVASKVMPLWEATRSRTGREDVPPPLWAFAWPGGQAIARYLLDNHQVVAGRRVLDFGSGGGIAGLAAARAGAASVVLCDVDPLAAVLQAANATLNDVAVASRTQDIIGESLVGEFDVVLAADVTYDWVLTRRIEPWLQQTAQDGLLVLLADPGRKYLPNITMESVVDYEVPTLRELEVEDCMRTTLWRVLAD